MGRGTSKRNAVGRQQQRDVASPIIINNNNNNNNNTTIAKAPLERQSTTKRQHDQLYPNVYLSLRSNATASSWSDMDPFAFKVNAFDLWTPRPAVHYIEAPMDRSLNHSLASVLQKDKQPTLQQGLHTNNRVEDLADDLDAGALRELLERDQRRKERRHIERQREREQRLKRLAERERHPTSQGISQESGEQAAPLSDDTRRNETDRVVEPLLENTQVPCSKVDASKPATHLGAGAVSVDTRRSMSTTSPAKSIQHRINSPSTSQVFSVAPGSTTSDLTRNVGPESKSSGQQGRSKRGNALTSLIRRGSSRLKGTRQKPTMMGGDQQASNAASSRESFKVHHHTMPRPGHPLPSIRSTSSPGSSTFNRPHSKFREHFANEGEPPSVPVSRLQSSEPITTTSVDEDDDGSKKPRRSWDDDNESIIEGEGDGDNVHLSLASVDSEGSWMSGEFLRRISQQRLHPVRESVGSAKPEAVQEDDRERTPQQQQDHHHHHHQHRQRPFSGRGSFAEASTRASSTALGNENEDGRDEETWHEEIGRRPMVVTPEGRPKSAHVLLLRNVNELSPTSLSDGEDDFARQPAG